MRATELQFHYLTISICQKDVEVYTILNQVCSRLSQQRNCVQKSRWFTEFCNSHCLSHFAAFFIDMGTKISIVEKFIMFLFYIHQSILRVVRRHKFSFRQSAHMTIQVVIIRSIDVNDPSAGSPTETLLRLLLPLDDKVYLISSRRSRHKQPRVHADSPDHSIGRSDGRCVQRAGT